MSLAISDEATYAQTVQAIYNVFFASLMMMLVLSSGIILYGGLYWSNEAEFLLTTPIRPERIVLHKFQEAIVFSSWGFLLLGSPMLVAYGLQANAPWYYFALLPAFMGAFVYIPGGPGAIVCMLFVHHYRADAAAFSVVGVGGRGGGRCCYWLVVVGPHRRRSADAVVVSRNAGPTAVQRAPTAAQLVA